MGKKGKSYKNFRIHCAKCKTYILSYHKHGAGNRILRFYFVHIVAPESLVEILNADYDRINQVPNLACPSCEEIIGTPTLSRSKKPVYRARQGYFGRKLGGK